MHTLGYADDAALIDYDQVTATERVTAIVRGSNIEADMQISIPKTKCMFVQDQGPKPKVSCEEARAQASFKCPHVGCKFVFNNAHGVRIHAGRCVRRNVHNMEKILEVKGTEGKPSRRFLVRWEGFGSEDDTWEPYSNLPPEEIKTFLLANNIYNHEWHGARRERCDKPCKNERGVKMHARFCYCTQFQDNQQSFIGRKAEEKARVCKLTESQKQRPEVKCDGKSLENVFKFKYLGSIFAADDSQMFDIERRVALAIVVVRMVYGIPPYTRQGDYLISGGGTSFYMCHWV